MTSLLPLRRALLVGLIALTLPAAAQTLDPTFQPIDARVSYLDYSVYGSSLAADAQGRVVIGGNFNFVAGQPVGNVTRLLADGTLDASFNPGGTGANAQVSHVTRLAGGQWLIAGWFTRYNGQPAYQLARLHPDGALDTTFRAGIGAPDVVWPAVVDGQGRVVMVRYTRNPNRSWTPGLLRLLPSGAVDPSFQPANTLGADSTITALAVDAADRILVSHLAYQTRNLERVLPSGALDTTFNVGQPGLVGGWIRHIKPLANGQLVVVVDAGPPTYNGTPLPDVFKLNADGTPDPTFDCPVRGYSLQVVEETPGGVLLGGGNLSTGPVTIPVSLLRLRPDGAVDTTFSGPKLADQYNASGVRDLAVGPGGRLLLAGQFQQLWGHATADFGQLLQTGAADPTFTTAGLDAHGYVQGLVRQSGDRLLVTGEFRSVNGHPAPAITRLLADGAVDPSFQPDSALILATLNRLPLQVDGADRILGMAINTGQVLRFLPNGQRDPAFLLGGGPGGLVRGQVHSTAVYPDGRALVAGDFDTYNGQPCRSLVRLLADGTVDPSFQPPDSLAGTSVQRIALLPDGSIGALASSGAQFPFPYPSSGASGMYWLDATGQPLPTFNGGQPDTLVTELLMGLADTTLLIRRMEAGSPVPVGRKLTRAGTVVPGFEVDPTIASIEYRVVPQPDGRLLVIGEFMPYQFSTLRRLTPSGALDPTFRMPSFEAHGLVAVVFQSTGKMVAGGAFETVDGAARPTLVRLSGLVTGLPASRTVGAGALLDVFPNPAHATLTLRRAAAEPATATLVDVLGRPVRRWTLTAAETRLPLTGVTPGTYVVRVVGQAGVATRRVVVE